MIAEKVENSKDFKQNDFERMCHDKEPFTVGVKHDFFLFNIVKMKAQVNHEWIVPKYSYLTKSQRENWTRKVHGQLQFKKFLPKYCVDEHDNQQFDWVNEPFDTIGNDDMSDEVINHLSKGKKGMPGVSSSMLFTVWKRLSTSLEWENLLIPVETKPGPSNSNDPESVQSFLDSNVPKKSKDENKMVGKAQKLERFKKLGKRLPHQPLPFELRKARMDPNALDIEPLEDAMDLDPFEDSMDVDLPTLKSKDALPPVPDKIVAPTPAKIYPAKIPIPLLDSSLEPIHFTFDWQGTREFYDLYFGLQLPEQKILGQLWTQQICRISMLVVRENVHLVVGQNTNLNFQLPMY